MYALCPDQKSGKCVTEHSHKNHTLFEKHLAKLQNLFALVVKEGVSTGSPGANQKRSVGTGLPECRTEGSFLT